MVNIKDISGISGQATAGLNANMQTLQTAIAAKLKERGQNFDLIQQGISSGAPLVRDYLQRKSGRDDQKREIERNKEYGNNVADALGLPSLSEVEKFEGLELNTGDVSQTPDGKFQLAASNVDPQKIAYSKAIRSGMYSPANIDKMDKLLSYSGDLTPGAVEDKYKALNTQSEYQSLEGSPGTGTSRRDVTRDVGIDKGRADIANVYDAINKRVPGGGKGDKMSKEESVAAGASALFDALKLINQDSNLLTRLGSGAVSAVSGGAAGGELGNKINAYKSFRDAIGVEIAKIGQSGNLTEPEQKRAFALLPHPLTQTVKRQEEQYKLFAAYINSKIGEQVFPPTMDLSGKDVVDTATQSQPSQQKSSGDGYNFRFRDID